MTEKLERERKEKLAQAVLLFSTSVMEVLVRRCFEAFREERRVEKLRREKEKKIDVAKRRKSSAKNSIDQTASEKLS